jgi:septum formation protein
LGDPRARAAGGGEGPEAAASPDSPLVLASRSPRRRAILEQLGIRFEVCLPSADELSAGEPDEVARANALAKARSVARDVGSERLVLGVDTVVSLDARLYGKPEDAGQAHEWLARLSGRRHEVWSGVALVRGAVERVGTARTAVTFRELSPRLVEWYVTSGEWRDRAGAYAIQGRGAALVERIEGDYWNVVGLPVPLLLDLEPNLLH